MRTILQRVETASVKVDGELVGEIGRGVLALIGVERGDGPMEAAVTAKKLAEMRLFEDDRGRMNLDCAAVGGAFLIVSQFTLAASLRRGRRPSLNNAAPPAEAEPLVEAVISALRERGFRVERGRFGEQMKVGLINDGPVTLVLEAREGKVV